MLSRIKLFFEDRKRARIRKTKNAHFVKDYILCSEVTDYRRLRFVINGLLGLILCSLLYYFGWKRLNFGDFDPHVFARCVKWAVILSTTVIFAWSPTFRTALMILMVGALGKNGQAPLALLVTNNLSDGPIENIIENFKLTAETIVCHLKLQAMIVSKRVALFTGPLEDLLEQQLTKGLLVLKKSIGYVRRLIAPFMADIREEETSEDIVMSKAEKQLSVLAQRRALGAGLADEEEADQSLTEAEMRNATNTRPSWTRFKTGIGRRIVRRMNERCRDIFSKGIGKCRTLFASVQKKCYDSLPVLINHFVCKKFTMESSCQDLSRRRQQLSACRQQAGSSGGNSQSMEGEMRDVVNMTKDMERELRVNLHMIAMESPRLEMEYSLHDMMLILRAAVLWLKMVLLQVRHLILAVLIFTVYKLFSQAVAMIEHYNGHVDFNNCFIKRNFWKIDKKRQEEGKMALLRLEKSEWKKWQLRKFRSKPTKAEIWAARKPFFIWLMMAFFTVTVILVDWYFYSFLDQLVTSSKRTMKMESNATAEIVVLGRGVVADFVNKMIKINGTTELEEELTNTHCLTSPKRPDLWSYFWWIGLPLLLQLLLQVIFSFVIKRAILNYFLPFMFPMRARVRLIYLYNKILLMRHKDRQEARARIRFAVQRWAIDEEEEGDRAWPGPKSFVKLQILDRLFKTGQCLLCQTYMRPAKLKFCSACPATFCRHCIEEMHGCCYACQAETGQVHSAMTQLLPPPPPPSKVEGVSLPPPPPANGFVTNEQKAKMGPKK